MATKPPTFLLCYYTDAEGIKHKFSINVTSEILDLIKSGPDTIIYY